MKVPNEIVLLFAATSLGLTGCQADVDPDSSTDTGSESSVMSAPYVPTLAYDDTSVTLVWDKPDDYSDIVDYRVYMNGQSLGLASDNNTEFNPAKPYIDVFEQQDSDNFHHQTTYLNFKVTDLTPATGYQFSVAAVHSDGQESTPSPVVSVTTASFSQVVDITDYGALGDGSTLNTSAIQSAIDACAASSTSAYGCKVVVPADDSNGAVFVTGALFLASNMTFEIETGATLQGSQSSEDYPLSQGYQLYSYRTNSTDSRRPPSLLNVLSSDHMNTTNDTQDGYDHRRGVFENIRVTGGGTLDGSGWQVSGETADEAGNTLPYHAPGSREKVYTLGVLAKNQMVAGYQEFYPEWDGDVSTVEYQEQINRDLYSNRRSSLATFRGVTNLYFGELTLHNPAYHGIMFLENENTVFAYTTTQTFDINNADGVEFGNSSDFLVFANFIDSGDDCINFAAGQGADYDSSLDDVNPTQGGWVFNNYTREGHGVLVAGSHTGAWIEDILAEENVAFMTDNGLRLKSTPATGGGARDIVFRDNAMKDIGTDNTHEINGVEIDNRGGKGNGFIFTLSYSAGDNVYTNADSAAYFHDITVQNVTLDNVDASASAKAVIHSDAYDGSDSSLDYAANYHQNIVFDHVAIRNSKVTDISRFKDATFSHVSFENWESGYDSPWQISDSENVTFDDVTPQPQEE
ncbi:exo-poly-alpha-galacturonosidase [Vibrio xiamenensis]|uniref:Exo-poly-alpha-galacturonosidase n=1 Tax=Vibrio xiamenensis TaxID=861298 RepID=A0A1G8F9Q5_9VIBR|nr:glycoside hydrolase family 28 protein [Vibrio xiamenensis]SDH78886.1 exo-poly-alpha-galacturonosidase [Vibrio xiamenensis]